MISITYYYSRKYQLHRRLLYDDDKGVSEPLNETAFETGLIVRGTHTVQINDIAESVDAYRLKAIQSAYHPVPSFAKTELTIEQWFNQFNKSVRNFCSKTLVTLVLLIYTFIAVIFNFQFSLLTTELPSNIHVLTLQRWRENEVLLRLEHIFEINESSVYAKSEMINLKVNITGSLFVKSIRGSSLISFHEYFFVQKLFSYFVVNSIRELTLGANFEREKLERMKWIYKDQNIENQEMNSEPEPDTIILHPMQIRTFLLNVGVKNR